MAPHPDNPRLPIWHVGTTSQTSGSATPSAADQNANHASPTHSLRPSPQLGQASTNTDSKTHINESSAALRKVTADKRKAITKDSPSKSIKVPRPGNGRPAGAQSRIGGNHNIPRDTSPAPSGGGDPEEPSSVALDSDTRPAEKPLCSLREIIYAMICKASPLGLILFLETCRQHYINVGTLCSGTDAPVHVMHLFSMFKNLAGKPVFGIRNIFGCEIEEWKQSFLMRNSRPGLLFKDARDFAQGDATRARLVTGAEADIPCVDFFIAGTSCVDFSTLSSTKIQHFAGLSHALKEWSKMKQKHGDKLSFQHLSDDDWRSAIGAMSEETERKHTSTKTFAAGMNYVKWKQPKIAIFENVDSAPWHKLVESGIFQLMGYTATVLRLDTKHFYMPQTRVRKYLIAFSHRAFTMEGAQALCKMFDTILVSLQHTHSSSVTDFTLPPNSHELHKARNEMEVAAQGVRERESNWAFSKARHTAYRRKYNIPDLRPWMQWLENAHANSPVNMWRPWANRMPLRVLDLLECLNLYALYGKSILLGPYDMKFKAQIIDCSQNVDRISPDIKFGRTGCLTPNAIPVLTLEARPITGTESLRLQGLPIENFDMSVETQAQLQDLAGNAMTTTVVGAVILAALSAVARVAQEEGFDWLQTLFDEGDVKPVGKILNSFHDDGANIDHGTQIPLHLKLYAHSIPVDPAAYPQSAVRDILALGRRARRRCPCRHILAYSSVELYVCTVCGVSHCKSCKGNPQHALVKSPSSLEDIKSLPYAQAEYEFRKCFPQMLWMRSPTDKLVQKLDRALLASTCDRSQRGDLAKAIIDGLCDSTYQLQFVEITDSVRLEYFAGSAFNIRVIVEESEVIWYFHLGQYSSTARLLSGVLPKGGPIARAVLGREEENQFPGAQEWEFWTPHKVSFPLDFEVQDQQALRLINVGDLEGVPHQTWQSIKDLEGSLWNFHPECGFPEDALWVFEEDEHNLFMFKNVDPIGPAGEDAFVISPVSREMGRTAPREYRPVLLTILKEFQIHRNFKDVLMEDGPFLVGVGHRISVEGLIDGWWERLSTHGINAKPFPNIGYKGVKGLAKAAPTSIRGPGDLSQAERYETSCDEFQSLLTTSLPILGNEKEVMETKETLETLDLTQPLDLAELAKLIGPLYSAVEMGLVGTGHRVSVIQENVELRSDCPSCAPQIPEAFYIRSATDKAGISRATGPAVARHRAVDQQNYELNLQSKPPLLHVDHNVTSPPFDNLQLKKDGFHYIDVRFVAHGHALLHQARAHLPQHPSQYEDTTETRGTFAMEVAVIENPRVVLELPKISPPEPVELEDATLPSGFQNGLKLFKEQSDSLQWMLQRESIDGLEAFRETETAEVYQEQLHLRVYADAKRPVFRRGRVVADNVGFGKTAVCLGLIDVQYSTDRKEFMEMREKNEHLKGLIHLKATLIIVPNQLTEQWSNESKRFLGQKQYTIIVIQSFAQLQQRGVSGLKSADIIICSNKVFQDNKYHSQLSRYCSTNDLDKIQTLQKVYRAWYKAAQSVLKQVLGDAISICKQGNKTLSSRQTADLLDKLDQIRTDRQELDGGEQLCFVPDNEKTKQSRRKKANSWDPQVLFEMFSYSRIIWDEFPYENIPVTEFVANCATTSKWMLSGTPPLSTLGDVCKIAYLFNVHVARPLQLVKGRQPPICENEPLAPHSDLESTTLFQSRHSPKVLKVRHEQSVAFVQFFMRKNHRETDVAKVETPIVLTMSTIAFLYYAELQDELRSRQYNANNVGTECRRRLMGHLDWKGKESGRDRSVEALTIRASASPDDVLRQSDLVGHTDLEAARKLLSITEDEIQGIENRGRDLLGKAIFLAYRLTFITLSNPKDELDGQDERQLDYYQNLVDIVESVLTMDMKVFQSWEAFESAMRMLIWDEPMRKALNDFRSCHDGPGEQKFVVVLRKVFNCMRLCSPPTTEPELPDQAELRNTKSRSNFEAKKKFFEIFRSWIPKTACHSRRWFLLDKVASLDAAEDELLRLEWMEKVLWEKHYDDKEPGHARMVVPAHELEQPKSAPLQPVPFDLEHLKSLDKSRRQRLSEVETVDADAAVAMMAGRDDFKDSKAFWEEECNRRGLIAKSTDKKEVLMARVVADTSKSATDKDYVSPESCGVALTDFPQQGKKRIRGGHMEVIFDGLMQAIDGLTSVFERSVVIHARRNLQAVVAWILGGNWRCKNSPGCGDNPDAHYLSLLCGHVYCGQPDDSRPCNFDKLCQRSVKNVCIPFSKITKTERVITATSLFGAITQDPEPYLDADPAYEGSTKGPKARAVINLISRISNADQVVVFVQNTTIENEIYRELDAAQVRHVTATMLSNNEAGSLEGFKNGKHKVLVQTVNSEQAAGSNLHNANHVIFVSPLISRRQADWDAQMKQALGRCVRFRQSKRVYVYHMLMDETTEVDTLEWRMKREVIVRDGQAVGRFNNCSTKNFLARYEGDESAARIRMAQNEGRIHSILPRDDVQYLMGDDLLSLAAIKALRTIDESIADNKVQDEDEVNPEVYLEEPEDDNEDVEMTDVEYEEEDIYGA
ncbi:hypothetical protein F5883DRAFT_685573 [Diaporthe sp. PMI_573]|nr:hypothetical protein F5883DRAFT_685573 [Diaporthaceae sp. PMI_573]